MKINVRVVSTVLLASAISGNALACSICRCGDPTFNALGKEGAPENGLRLALDWDRVEKSQGAGADFESITEDRVTLLGAYGFNDRLTAIARVPYSHRSLESNESGTPEKDDASGRADPELYGQVRLWSSPFTAEVGSRTSVYAVFGVKTNWGENDLSRNGERLDEHLQPGTGSTDWFGGVAGSYQLDRKSALFASTQYRVTGRNDVGYQYGNAWLLNFAYEHKFTSMIDGVIEANYRHAGIDKIDNSNAEDPNTGGSILYITPRMLFDLGQGWVVRAAVQIPTTQSGLNGVQEEKTVINIGITKLLAR